MARGVDEGQPVAVPVDLVGTDVLGDPSRLGVGDVGAADLVQELRLAVVHVAHHRDHRRSGRGILRQVILVDLQQSQHLGLLLLPWVDEDDFGADFGGKQLDHVVSQRLGSRNHFALLHEEPDQVGGGPVQLRCDFLGRAGPLHDHFPLGYRGVVGGVGSGVHRLEFLTAATTAPLPAATARSPGTGPGAPSGVTGPARSPAGSAGPRAGTRDGLSGSTPGRRAAASGQWSRAATRRRAIRWASTCPTGSRRRRDRLTGRRHR